MDASSHFSTTLDIAQKRIDSAISAKLDQFLSLADYDWTPKEARKEGQEADFLPEMVQWLSTMMESVLVTLPIATKMQAYKAAFQYMGDQMLVSLILDSTFSSLFVLYSFWTPNLFFSILSLSFSLLLWQNAYLLSKDDPSVNLLALRNLDIDVAYLNAYAVKLGDSSFESVFGEIRQVSWKTLVQTLSISISRSYSFLLTLTT